VHKAARKKRHKSIDFNALVERADPNDTANNFNDRKCRSVIKNIYIDTHSVGRASYDNRSDANSIKIHFRRPNPNPNSNPNTNPNLAPNPNHTSKSREDRRADIQSLLERRSSSKRARKTDENDYRTAVNRLVK